MPIDSDGVFDESAKRIRATVGDDGETNTSRGATVFSIIEIGSRLAVTHLYGARDQNLVMDAPAFAPTFSFSVVRATSSIGWCLTARR